MVSVRPSHHAVSRFQMHYPQADRDDLCQAWHEGIPVPEEVARPLLGRGTLSRYGGKNLYVLPQDRKGLLAGFEEQDCSVTVVTYLRFGNIQENFAKRHWPMPESAPSEPPPAPPTDPWEDPHYPVIMGVSKELVYSTPFPPADGVQLRLIRILPGFLQLAGGPALARRYLMFGKPGGPSQGKEEFRWDIKLQNKRIETVLLFKVNTPKGDEWWAGTFGSEPPEQPKDHREGRPVGGADQYLVVKPHTKPSKWVVALHPGNRDLGTEETRAEALERAKALCEGAPIYLWDECIHCGKEVCADYRVKAEVWAQSKAGPGNLHIWCLEARLGRDLIMDDLSDDPVNDAILFGFRLGQKATSTLRTD